MKVTLESTTKIVTVNGQPARIWQGQTERGVPVEAAVAMVAARDDHDQAEFERDLEEHAAPTTGAFEAERSASGFSTAWTDEERLKLVSVMIDQIQTDIGAGRYGQPGRPNLSAVHEVIMAAHSDLESHRAPIEAMVALSIEEEESRADFYKTPLTMMRQLVADFDAELEAVAAERKS